MAGSVENAAVLHVLAWTCARLEWAKSVLQWTVSVGTVVIAQDLACEELRAFTDAMHFRKLEALLFVSEVTVGSSCPGSRQRNQLLYEKKAWDCTKGVQFSTVCFRGATRSRADRLGKRKPSSLSL